MNCQEAWLSEPNYGKIFDKLRETRSVNAIDYEYPGYVAERA